MVQPDTLGNWRPLLVAVGIVTLARVLLLWISPTDLYVDESQYWVWGQNLDLGYYSKPPMIGWVLRLFDELAAHRSAFSVRLPAPLFHGATALLLGVWAQSLMPENRRAALWVAMAYLSLPIVTVGSFLMSTDTIMAPFLVGALVLYWRVCEGGKPIHALAGGLLLGLAFMSKYAAIYFLPGAAIAYAIHPAMRPSGRHLLLFLAGFLISASPNIVWNIANDLTTVSHTMDNVGWIKEESAGPSLNFGSLAEFAASQFAVFGPVFMVFWLIALRAPAPSRRRALLWFSIPVWLIVLTQALLSRAYANWAFAAIPPATIVAILWALERDSSRWLKIGFGINIAVVLVISFLVAFPMAIKGDDGQPFAKRYVNIAGLSRDAFELAEHNGLSTIVANNRGILADLFFTGADRDFALYSRPHKGAPKHYYAQKKALPKSLEGKVLYVGYAEKLTCKGTAVEPVADLAQEVGTWTNVPIPAYIVDAACLR
ncbi:dolichyl-phosphate-mannose-protein mannosyltransferase [Shimia isoporae]|uniref:Dolichyl-phosphate-mannose-protein mannosyltransferase n=1 Tax=Shimia isoporae TaxID=647720 RepID=A0A4R1N2J1_9RHOB|nr:glycosyltransferase family 39 protein [Shimia isoporae]TCL00610.1 dolichyl-phosphate-mannose-protein mannosyltransferase [Shimia isoporae]